MKTGLGVIFEGWNWRWVVVVCLATAALWYDSWLVLAPVLAVAINTEAINGVLPSTDPTADRRREGLDPGRE